MEIKLEIGFIMSFLASFWKSNSHVPSGIQSFAVRALSNQNDELMYAISSKEIAELMSEGKSIEWLKNTIFQDNSEEYRVSVAKRKISEIENALREVICDVLSKNHGVQWWDNCIERSIRGSAGSAYRNQTGATSSDGNVLISYTYLLQLKRITTDNWGDFSHIFQNKTNFESWLDDLNSIRREESHNRPITNAHIVSLNQIYEKILQGISQYYPEAVSNYMLENWRERVAAVLEDYSEKQSQLEVGREFGLHQNLENMKTSINRLADVETRLMSIPVPSTKSDSHAELLVLIGRLKASFEEMVHYAKTGDVEGVEKAAAKSNEVNNEINSFTEKILLSAS
jgi:hypothetical protein